MDLRSYFVGQQSSVLPEMMSPLVISEQEIRRHSPGSALRAFWRQRRAERGLARRGVHFRATDPDAVAAAYAAMNEQEFDGINARQNWANWRTIPRALGGHVPDRPLTVVDLGCGTGSSTRVLAFYCPVGSTIIGYEMVAPLLACARRRSYIQRDGQAVGVDFICQGVTEPFRRADGNLVSDESVDVVNASGVVGHHLDVYRIRPLIAELRRVLRPGAVAMLDVGPALSRKTLIAAMAAAAFQVLAHRRSWLFDLTGQVVFRKAQ